MIGNWIMIGLNVKKKPNDRCQIENIEINNHDKYRSEVVVEVDMI